MSFVFPLLNTSSVFASDFSAFLVPDFSAVVAPEFSLVDSFMFSVMSFSTLLLSVVAIVVSVAALTSCLLVSAVPNPAITNNATNPIPQNNDNNFSNISLISLQNGRVFPTHLHRFNHQFYLIPFATIEPTMPTQYDSSV